MIWKRGLDAYLTLILSALLLALAGVIYFEWEAGGKLQHKLLHDVARAPGHAPGSHILPDFILSAADSSYAEMLARPIFSATRRPPAPAQEGESSMKKGQFSLAGVVITSKVRMAYLRDVATGKTVRAEQGKEIRGMAIAEVDAGKVILKQGGEEEILSLKVIVLSKPQGQPAPVPAPTPTLPATGAPTPPLSTLNVAPPSASASSAPGTPILPQPTSNAAPPSTPAVSAKSKEMINRRRIELGLPPLDLPTAN